MARKFSLQLTRRMECPKCQASNDLTSNRRVLFNARRVIPPTTTRPEGEIIPENVQVFCGVCTFLIETFDPADYANGG